MLPIAFLLPFLLGLSHGTMDKPHEEVAWVYELIRSDNSRMAAWGAHYAGKYGLTGCASAIRKNLERENRNESGMARLAREVTLDALIRLGDDVPARLLTARFDPNCLDEIVILLAADPEENVEALFQLLDHAQRDQLTWWAAAAILASQRPPGLADLLIDAVRLKLSVTVRDPGCRTFNDVIGIGGGCRGRSTGRTWPPHSSYIFAFEPVRGYTIVQAKPIFLSFKRTEKSPLFELDYLVKPPRQSRYAVTFLLAMIRDPVYGLPPDGEERITIDWTSSRDYLEKVEAHERRLREAHAELVESLVDMELLTPEAAKRIQPIIEVVQHDRRSRKEPPLPPLPGVK